MMVTEEKEGGGRGDFIYEKDLTRGGRSHMDHPDTGGNKDDTKILSITRNKLLDVVCC